MKKLLIIALLFGSVTLARATVTLTFNVGILTLADGTTAIPDHSLLQILAAPAMVDFTAATATEFTSGNEFVLKSVDFDSSTGFPVTAGKITTVVASIPISTLPPGYFLKLQWFPTLTLSSAAGAPGYGTTFGAYTNVAWTSPSDGGTQTYDFLTTSAGGSVANSVGSSSLMTASAVPEPSTYAAIFGMLALAGAAYKRRQLV